MSGGPKRSEVPRIQRRRRVRCRLRCEVLEGRRRSTEAAILSLSEGGLSLEVARGVDQGDGLRLRIAPKAGAAGVRVDAIVWNHRVVSHTRKGLKRYVLGCVVSDPPPDFLRLLDRLEQRNAPPAPRALPLAGRRAAAPEPEVDLPRSRAPMPPPKPEPEETLPRFRVRLKQVGGPRSRNVQVRARSLADAEARARAEIDASGDWQILDVVPG